MKKSIKMSSLAICGLALGSLVMLNQTPTHADTSKQRQVALVNQPTKKVVNNHDYAIIPAYTYGSGKDYQSSHTYQSTPETYQYRKGNFKMSAKTKYFLPVTHESSGDLANPQSIAQTPDGHYAYVMYATGDHNIIRYDLWKLNSLGVDTTNMAALRRGINNNADIQSAVKYSGHIDAGHGQSLSYNPKNHKLYFLRMAVTSNTPTLVEVNPNNLNIMHETKFTFSHQYSINNDLTIDKHGNFYTYIKHMDNGKHSGGITIYKGTINAKHQIKFHAIQQGLAHAPGYHTQGMGYNPQNNRLYFVSDGTITSVPINKLGHLKPKDVHTTQFDTNREFEGITFNQNGHGMILMNRGAELAQISNNNF